MPIYEQSGSSECFIILHAYTHARTHACTHTRTHTHTHTHIQTWSRLGPPAVWNDTSQGGVGSCGLPQLNTQQPTWYMQLYFDKHNERIKRRVRGLHVWPLKKLPHHIGLAKGIQGWQHRTSKGMSGVDNIGPTKECQGWQHRTS